MLKFKLGIVGIDKVKGKNFFTEMEHESRSLLFFTTQELPDIFSYYEYCGFNVLGIEYKMVSKNPYSWRIYY